LYCKGCERFLSEKELVDEKCPDHLVEPEFVKEKNYYFRMSKYQDWLIDHIQTHDDFIRPKQYKNEILSFLKEPLRDLCISRPKSRLQWGIPLPFDDNYVTYVWFDALLNYLTVLDYPAGDKFKTYWYEAEHLVAKDIIKPHGIYWPTMLRAAGIPLYKHLTVHGYWTMITDEQAETGQKISKSLGNVVDPLVLGNEYGVDSLRYVLIREMIFGQDATFSERLFKERFNSDLANDLGNLVSRLITMIAIYCNATIPACGTLQDRDKAIWELIHRVPKRAMEAIEEVRIHDTAKEAINLVRAVNKYVNDTKPWKLAKENKQADINTILHTCTVGLLVAGRVFYPIMPGKMKELFGALGCKNLSFRFDAPMEIDGAQVAEAVNLFPRIDKEKLQGKQDPTAPKKDKQSAGSNKQTDSNQIEFDDFLKLDIRTATVLEATKVEKADKLLQLQVSIGAETRQVIAGIAEYYTPEALVGKKLIILTNLKPRKIRGLESQGMILAVDHEGTLAWLTPSVDMPDGLRIR